MEIRLKEVEEALLATKGILDVRWIEEKDRTVIRGMEEQLCKQRFGISRKTPLANGQHLADAVVGMMDAVALMYGDKPSPAKV